jgi:hypothetical protein
VLANVARMAELFRQSAFVFLENDSRDATKFELRRWCEGKERARLISLDGLARASPVRTVRLATARNHLVSAARRDFKDFDYLFILDCDGINAPRIDLEAVRSALAFLQENEDRAAVFANQPGVYSDLWAFRHPELCPGDVWEEVLDYVTTHHAVDAEAFGQTFAKRVFSLPSASPPLEVCSAFGGLGIYKMASVIRNTRQYVGHKEKSLSSEAAKWIGKTGGEIGWQSCEHVPFNEGLRALGQRLYVLPYLLNDEGPITFPPSAWRTMLFDLRLVPAPGFERKLGADWGKVGRNEDCPCGSGKRYKHCHGAAA